MANYYSQASFILPLSKEQTSFAFDVLECVEDEAMDFLLNKDRGDYSADIYKVAKDFALSIDDYKDSVGSLSVGFNAEAAKPGIWFAHDESINSDNAANFIQQLFQYFNVDTSFGFEISHTCSKARLDAFGGTAVFITKDSIKYMGTSDWLNKEEEKFNADKGDRK